MPAYTICHSGVQAFFPTKEVSALITTLAQYGLVISDSYIGSPGFLTMLSFIVCQLSFIIIKIVHISLKKSHWCLPLLGLNLHLIHSNLYIEWQNCHNI